MMPMNKLIGWAISHLLKQVQPLAAGMINHIEITA
jgi:hypothetical protein